MSLPNRISNFRWLTLTAFSLVIFPAAAYLEQSEATSDNEEGPKPTISRMNPVTGPTSGGQTVKIYGTNFRKESKIFFGGKEVKEKRVGSQGTLIEVETPSGKGTVEVIIENPDKTKVTRNKAYHFGQGLSAGVFRIKYGLGLFWFWVQAGKWVMYPIMALSILALALIFHCLFSIRENQLIPKELVEDVAEYLVNGKLDNAAEYCRKKSCAFGRIVLSGINKSDQQAEIIRDTMGSAGVREAEAVFQKINYLSNIGTVAPMMGLFGTVWGLQLAFLEISGAGAQHQVLAGAIAVALNTTVAGLIVGIGSFVGYFLFRGRVVRLVSQMEILAEEMAERIIQRKGDEE